MYKSNYKLLYYMHTQIQYPCYVYLLIIVKYVSPAEQTNIPWLIQALWLVVSVITATLRFVITAVAV